MKIEYFSIKKQYEISCKIFLPDDGRIDNVIIGVHGFAGDKESSMLKKLATTFCLHNSAVLSFDFPAHGNSLADEKLLTINNCKNDLYTVLEYVSNEYPSAGKSIFATSFGGYITLLCADKFVNIPLVLRAPAVTMPKVLLENVLKINANDFKAAKYIECGFERPINLSYSFYEDLLSQEVIGSKQISLPILIIHGDRDDIVPLSDIEAFSSSQSNVSLKIISGADHRFKNEGEIETIVDITKTFLNI